MKSLLLAFLSVFLFQASAYSASYDFSVNVLFDQSSNIYEYHYSLAEFGAREGLLRIVLETNTGPLSQPEYLPLSSNLPQGWIIEPYSPFNFGPSQPDLVYNGGYVLYSQPTELTNWDFSIYTQYAPKLGRSIITYGEAHPYTHIFQNIIMPNYDGSYVETEFSSVPEPSTMLLLGAGLAGLVIWRKKYRV